MKTPRQIVFDTLMRVLNDGAYSNIAIDMAIRENKLEKANAAFTSALFYGVLENNIKLDYIIKSHIKKPLSSLDREILYILRMGIYQLLEMHSVPDNAAVDESVKLCAYARKASAKGFVNAVLRGFIRNDKQYVLPPESDPIKRYSVKYSCPEWLLLQWSEQYELQMALDMARVSLNRAPLTIRVNTLKTSRTKLIGYLENKGVDCTKSDKLENCLELFHTGSIDKLPQYRQGLFYVQDIASQLCVEELGVRPEQIVLDMCAAPGSKSFTIAQNMQNEGEIYAFDLHEHKLKIMKDSAKRLGISIIKTMVHDSSVYDETIPMADRILCDVPCSGLGIIRRKPEIKYKNPDDMLDLPELQYKILANAAKYLKKGGKLIYSTCTTNKRENEDVIFKFLSNNNCYKPLQLSKKLSTIEGSQNFYVTLLPFNNQSDGFFIAVITKED